MATSTNELTLIKSRQQSWAKLNECEYNEKGYCSKVESNLFGRCLSAEARAEIAEGHGSELGDSITPGKFQALHSSSALAYNWFEYWRHRDHAPLSNALGLAQPFVTLRFEAQFPTGVGRSIANLDVLLTCGDGSLNAIESKFCEPYTPSDKKIFIKPAYFDGGRSRWAENGLPKAQVIADQLHRGVSDFEVLDIAQLLKHMLALSRTRQRWKLFFLWHELPGRTASKHRAELVRFSELLADEGKLFTALTYDELFDRLEAVGSSEHSEYLHYISGRYGALEKTHPMRG
jgi:hypothetical protein